jgi:hypothetical protein
VARPWLPAELLIDAILVEEEDQFTRVVRSCMIPPGKVPVAVNCCVALTKMVGLAGASVIEETLDAVPFPESAAVCGLLLAPSVTVRVPV